MSDADQKFEELYLMYYNYIYDNLIHDQFNPNKTSFFCDKQSFRDQLEEEAHRIKVTDGY